MISRACVLHSAHDIRLQTQPVSNVGAGDVKIAILAGGICGSDLHYYHDGGIGPIRVREPIIVGHEAAGRVIEVGAGVSTVSEGDLVAVNPSQPCGSCKFCRAGEEVHCLEMRFMGSAYRYPHEQGLFRDFVVAPGRQVFRYGNKILPQEAACAEPLAVCLHAVSQAPDLNGQRVLITGAGPIGALCTAVARHAGATEIVVTDLQEMPLSVARRMGATETINLSSHPNGLEGYKSEKGAFDVVFECSAAPAAIRDALTCARPRGTLVMVGVAGETAVPINLIVSKEISVKGTHRFHQEFATAVNAIDTGKISVAPIISQSFDCAEVSTAFECAGDRTKSLKVHVLFDHER